MARQVRKSKKLIYVFCEGESEQEYAKCLRKIFSDIAVLIIPPPVSTGLFEKTKSKFDKEPRFRNNAEVIDEIWFFFDAECCDAGQWEKRLKIIKRLRGLRKNPNIRVRLLMTSGCVEYWFYLHYEMAAPALHTVADKEKMLRKVQQIVSGYEKGDRTTIAKIAHRWPEAIRRGEEVLARLSQYGMPSAEPKNSDVRDAWLHRNEYTFTTVQEGIQFLKSLRDEQTQTEVQ